MTRNQQIIDIAQYSDQLIEIYIFFALGSQTGLLVFFIKLIALFISIKFLYNPFEVLLRYRIFFSEGHFKIRALWKNQRCYLMHIFHDLKQKLVVYFAKDMHFWEYRSYNFKC